MNIENISDEITIGNIAYGIAMSLFGFVIAVNSVITGAPSLEVELSRQFGSGLAIMLGGVIYTAGFFMGKIPLPEEGILASKWPWYLVTAVLVIGSLYHIISLMNKFSGTV